MPSIDFITFCHPGDIHRLYHNDWLINMVNSHKFHFNMVRVIHQRCANMPIPNGIPNVQALNCIGFKVSASESHPNILAEFGLPEQDDVADDYTHGPDAPHYWKWHVINHLIGLKVSGADYIVFSDSDCTIKSADSDQNWIRKGLALLQKYPEILIVSPGDGAVMAEAQTEEGYRLTRNVSQQLFLCERERLANIDFNIDWGGQFNAPGGPMQEYYFMLEGRIWRYLERENLWRCIVPDYVARYWHCNKLTEDGQFETDMSKY